MHHKLTALRLAVAGGLIGGIAMAEPIGLCHPSIQGTTCTCSLSSVEMALSFGEAAELIVVFERVDPGPHNAALLASMYRQCAHATAASLATAPPPSR